MVENSKVDFKTWGYVDAPQTLFSSGHLDRPDGHKIFYHEYGNPKGSPVIFLHGGPGGATDADFVRFFDPNYYRIILFDQRGCGESNPNVKDDLKAALTNNTTDHLVEDTEALRKKLLGDDTPAHVFGGSWGSTLALAYAMKYPEHVKSLALRGIFTCTKRDVGYFYQGNAKDYDDKHPEASPIEAEGAYRAYLADGTKSGMIPTEFRDESMAKGYAKAWHDYVTVIPREKRGDMVAAYHDIFHSESLSPAEKMKAAKAWSIWEGVTSNLCHDTSPEGVKRFADENFAIAFAAIENHFFYNGGFLDDTNRDHNVLTDPKNIEKIAHIPIYIVHGKYDQVCPILQADNLVRALHEAGANVDYRLTDAGHSMFEKENNNQLINFTNTIRDREMAHRNRAETSRKDPRSGQGK